ncbi:restriction endonuclease subunit S [Clostridium perfringens]|uniref:restriction endonuclease subunit S n=1 Tax=Clostridium perfringens TaxID=1502 RepID=UPI0018E41CB6|nr:restriction endonuclease subunit S [Clostridium perfringens]MBI5982739.1 restriction endonuclease subunit S [Clostridium perfringens]
MEKRLIEICTPKQWKTIATKDLLEDGYPVYGANGQIGFYDKYTHEEATLMITCRGATCGSLNISRPYSYINGNAMALDNLDENIDLKYLYYFLKSRGLLDTISGSAQPQITRNSLAKVIVRYPEKNLQLKIVRILDKVQELIDKRKEQIEELDLLVKSKFIEMFGDPYLNPKRWAKKELKEIMLLANNGLSRRGNDLDGNIVLRLVELQDGYLDYTSVNRIKLTESEEKRYLLKDGDFLFARVNGNPDNVGRCAYYQEIGEKVFHNDHIIRVRFDNTLINNCFVSTMLNSGYGKLQMKDKLKTSAGQYTVNQTGISEIKVVVPPIELQNKFEDFVKQIDKLKFEMEKSLKELEDNFNSLMQKAFRGELFK